jgi:hypothetical protein
LRDLEDLEKESALLDYPQEFLVVQDRNLNFATFVYNAA